MRRFALTERWNLKCAGTGRWSFSRPNLIYQSKNASFAGPYGAPIMAIGRKVTAHENRLFRFLCATRTCASHCVFCNGRCFKVSKILSAGHLEANIEVSCLRCRARWTERYTVTSSNLKAMTPMESLVMQSVARPLPNRIWLGAARSGNGVLERGGNGRVVLKVLFDNKPYAAVFDYYINKVTLKKGPTKKRYRRC